MRKADHTTPIPSSREEKRSREALTAAHSAQEAQKLKRKRLDAQAKERAHASALHDVKENGRHFSKIAARFMFKNTPRDYTSWVVQFRSELECYELLHVLTTNPESDGQDGDSSSASELERTQQKTVYHMILHCVPPEARAAVTLTLPQQRHHAFGAWTALRQLYIGNEEVYLEGLEKKFNKLHWLDSETFPEFELRYQSLLSELAMAGVPKLEHVKRSALMGAIEESSKKDARGTHVFDRLNTVSKIHADKPYSEWLSSVRTEAQQIHEAVQNTRGSARSAPSVARSENSPRDVSALSIMPDPGTSNSRGRKLVVVRRRGGAVAGSGGGSPAATLCRNWQNTGRCSYGASCKFSHEGAGQTGDSGGGSHRARSSSAAAAGTVKPCWEFIASGACRRGDSCSFNHSRGSPSPLAAGTNMDANAVEKSEYDNHHC